MGIFRKSSNSADSDSSKSLSSDASGSPGPYKGGYLKGSAISNPRKYFARTEAQVAREERKFKKAKD